MQEQLIESIDEFAKLKKYRAATQILAFIVTYAQKKPLTIDQLYFLANSCEGLLNDLNTQEITSEHQKQLCIYTCDQLITITECLENKDTTLDNKLGSYRLILVNLGNKEIKPAPPKQEPMPRKELIDLHRALYLISDDDLVKQIKYKINRIEQEYYSYIYERIKPTDFNCLKKRCQILLRHYQYNQARELLFEVLRKHRNDTLYSIAELCELQLLINQEELKPAQFLWQSYQQELHAIRSTIPPYFQDSKQQLPSEWVDAVITFQEKFSISIINLVKRIFADCVDLLGAPPQPCAFTLMAQGSASRKEMAPYSNIECCALLIEHRSIENQEYFLCLRKLFAFKMEVLGEYRPAGLRLDNEANPATEERLYGTVADIIKMNFESKLHNKADIINHSLLNNIVIYATNKELFAQYQQAIAQKQYQIQILARLKYLQRDPKKLLNLPIELADTFSLKGIFIAPLTYWLTEFAAFHGLAANSFSAALQAGQGKIFHQDFVSKLKQAWAQITIIRYREQLFYRQQQEEKGQVEQVSFKDKDKYQLTRQETDWLKTIHQQLIYPIYSIINHWIKHEQLKEQVQQLKDFHPTLAAININILPNQAASLFLKNYAIFCREHKLSASKILETYTKLPLGFRQKLKEYLPEFQSRYYTFPVANGERESCQLEEQQWQQQLSLLLIKDLGNYPQNLPQLEIRSASLGDCWLAPEAVRQLKEQKSMKADGHFMAKESQGRRTKGQHLVIPLKIEINNQPIQIYFKVFPEMPGNEYAAAMLTRRLVGHGAPYVELTRFNVGKNYYPVLISQGITGPEVESLIQNEQISTTLETQLSKKHYSQRVLSSLALNQEDGKGNNYIFAFCPKPNKTQCMLVCIDNDRSFSPSVIRDLKTDKPIPLVKDIVFCLNRMQDQIEAIARIEFLALDIEKLLSKWLLDLQNYSDKLSKTFSGQTIDRHTCVIPILFHERLIPELYVKLKRIQELLKEQPQITHIELLKKLDPYLGSYYQKLIKNHKTIAERFIRGFGEQYDIDKECITSTLTKQALQTYQGRPVKYQDIQKPRSYYAKEVMEQLKQTKQGYEQRKTIAEQLLAGNVTGLLMLTEVWSIYYRVQIINGIDFAEIDIDSELAKQEYQRNILSCIQTDCPSVKRLSLLNCAALTDRILKDILQCFPGLEKLNISGCTRLRKGSIKTIAEQSISLKKLEARRVQLKYVATNPFIPFIGDYQSIRFEELSILNLNECNKLQVVRIAAPRLKVFKAKNCEKLSRLELTEASLVAMDIAGSLQISSAQREKYADRFNAQGLQASEQGKYKKAEKYFSEAIELYPNKAKYYANRAETRRNLSKHEETIEDYSEILRLMPRFINNELEVKSRVLEWHFKPIHALIELRDGRLASGSQDKTIRIWDLSSAAYQKILKGHSREVYALTELRDGRLASGSQDKTIRIWDLSSVACQKILKGHSDWVMALTELKDGRLASGSRDKTIRIWDLSSGTCQKILKGHSHSVYALTELRDGRLASGSRDNAICIWDVSSGACQKILKWHYPVWALTELRDGRLAFGSQDKTIRIWDLSSGACQKILRGHFKPIHALIELRNGRLASGSLDNTIRIWDVSSGACQKILKGHLNSVLAIIELRDGRLASGSRDNTICIWAGNNPKVADLYYERAQLKFIFKHYREAIADYDAVILYKPNHVKAYCYRGIAQIKLKNITKAKADLKQVIKLAPTPKSIEAAEAYYQLAKIEGNAAYYQTTFNILQEYINNIEKSEEFTPETKALFYKRLGVIYEKGRGTKKDPAKAVHYYQAIQTTGFFAHSQQQYIASGKVDTKLTQ